MLLEMISYEYVIVPVRHDHDMNSGISLSYLGICTSLFFIFFLFIPLNNFQILYICMYMCVYLRM